ncbi:protein-methionine-S-oxide reductase [Dacryopinax primogenitus]|uniref:peptide-methionine (S)-S-oxide reductase n=1 Tax=Dacryopinax primogenitus (strain DJM 731) TaxID=1858805 RepID=M5G438_DACPD|nr:protein-methionine-S-oxide reductase [Dacryopinax primogenitus]EJU00602.1 protein-methionine-S-oxide reductase [Dacryopinax primogenitus]
MPHVQPPLLAPTVASTIAAQSQLTHEPSGKTETALFASGCFWGTEHIFRQYYDGRGLVDARVGFTGGDVKDPGYRRVCQGDTGHAEACKVEFDPGLVSFAELVEFFYRSHDPTTLNRQGGDMGTQYRSAIFYTTPSQKSTAEEVTRQVQEKHFSPKGKEIVTQIVEAGQWWDAEEYHQLYLEKNPNGYQCSTHRIWF